MLGDEPPEDAAEQEELRDDLARGEAELFALARVVTGERIETVSELPPDLAAFIASRS